MNSELIMKTDVLDILFEKRNKLYGAYTLRKFYNERLMKSIAGMLGLVVVFISFSFIESSETNMANSLLVKDVEMGRAENKKTPEIKPIHKIPRHIISADRFVGNIVVVDNKDSAAAIIKTLRDNAIIGVSYITEPIDESAPVGEAGNQYNGDAEPALEKADVAVIDPSTPMENAEIEPSFPGGMDALRRFLQRNLTNPKEMEEGEAVSVKVKFVVGYDGKLQHFETIEDGGSEFNNEVVRVLKKMPEWVPGKSGGRNVSVYYTIPVKFVADK